MQFHLNGFRPGDPDIAAPAPREGGTARSDIDVLIGGCGPAGLTLAAQMARFPDISTRIVEQKPGPLELGQADGIACRTMEMFQAFGFAHRVLREAYWVNEFAFWEPDRERRDGIVRARRIRDTEDGISEFPHVILNQARVHDHYLAAMRNAPSRLEPDYATRLVSLDIPADPAAPVAVTLERLDGAHAGERETVRARTVVGCDGARSAVRQALKIPLEGDYANQAWGVMDVLAVTDFPDIRLKCAIQSARDGSIVIIPREGGYLFRLYIELDALTPGARAASLGVTPERLIAQARRILHPYTLEVREIAWWSVYEIGQRVCPRFDDLKADSPPASVPRVFIAGDACHTHSPKAGQGMNVSMQDAFNLGWKLAAVLRGQASPALLHTYSEERQAVAQELIEFDRRLASLFSARPRDPSDPDGAGVDPGELQGYLARQLRFTAGVETQYRASPLIGDAGFQHLAAGFPVGRRFHSAPVVRLADAKAMELGHVAEADGRWRLFVFADATDPAAPGSRVRALCDFLARGVDSPLRRFTPEDADIDAVFDVRAVFQQGHRDLDPMAMHALLRPAKGRHGLTDYEKLFCVDPARDIFALRGIDRDAGCVVVVRPDQYVALVRPLDGFAALVRFFGGFMVSARETASVG